LTSLVLGQVELVWITIRGNHGPDTGSAFVRWRLAIACQFLVQNALCNDKDTGMLEDAEREKTNQCANKQREKEKLQ
jgi:hypothetical protein